MGYTAGTFSGSITRAAFDTELAAMRSWLNGGIVAADISAAVIERTHLFAPVTQGFPKQSSECETQRVYDRGQARSQQATQPRDVNANGRWWIARLPGRSSIYPRFLGRDDRWRIASLAARIHLPEASLVEVSAQWEAIATTEAQGSGSAPVHPDSAGRFRLGYEAVGASSATYLTGTERHLNISFLSNTAFAHAGYNLFTCGSQVSLSAGLYDVWLEYDLDGVSTTNIYDLRQIILGVGSLVIEAQRG